MKILSLLCLFVFILCVPAMLQAEISIHDNWDTVDKLSLEGVGWNAEFCKEEGALIISSNKKTLKILPFDSERAKSEKITLCKVVEDNKEKQVEIRAFFSTGQKEIEGSFIFGPQGTVQVKPSQNMEGISIIAEIGFGLVPDIITDDLIYSPEKYSSTSELHIPSENLFIGLLKGEDGMLICAWPSGNQKVKLLLKHSDKEEHLIQAVEIKLDKKDSYLRILHAPGIWHKEKLLSSYLEKDMQIAWKRPFPTRWKTELLIIDKIATAFPFGSKKTKTNRPGLGYYTYPVWFEGEKPLLHLSKKVSASGEVLIYALEGHKDTPVEFARKHLGSISKLKPKKGLRRYPGNHVGFTDCDGRGRVENIFKAGLQTREKELLQEVLADFLYSINCDAERLEGYYNFIQRMKEKIDSWSKKKKDNPELQSFFEQMKDNVKKLDEQYHGRMGGKKASEHLQHETEAINKLKVLIEEEGLEVYPEACYLLSQIRLWSLIEAVPASVGALAREWSRQAGYGCAENIAAVEYAEEIRREIRKFIGIGATYETIY